MKETHRKYCVGINFLKKIELAVITKISIVFRIFKKCFFEVYRVWNPVKSLGLSLSVL